MTSELERLEKISGRIHTVHDAKRVSEKVIEAPATLTDEDLAVAGFFFGKAGGDRARQARELALAPPAPAQTPAAPAVPFEQLSDDEQLKIAKATPIGAVTMEGFAEVLIDTIHRAIDGPRVAGRFDAIEQRLADLEARTAHDGAQRSAGLRTTEIRVAPHVVPAGTTADAGLAKAHLKFRGSWRADQPHMVDDLVETDDGALWRAELNYLHSVPGHGIGWSKVRPGDSQGAR